MINPYVVKLFAYDIIASKYHEKQSHKILCQKQTNVKYELNFVNKNYFKFYQIK